MKKWIKNYLTKLKENDKKGFSLVELIIVMAIMAILVGIVASQVIPYMEKSRQSKDQQQLSSVCTALVSAVAQSSVDVQTIAATTLSSVDNNTGATGSNIGDNLAGLLENGKTATDLGTISTAITTKFKSKAYSGKDIYVKYANGVAKVYVQDDSNAEPSDSSKLAAVSE